MKLQIEKTISRIGGDDRYLHSVSEVKKWTVDDFTKPIFELNGLEEVKLFFSGIGNIYSYDYSITNELNFDPLFTNGIITFFGAWFLLYLVFIKIFPRSKMFWKRIDYIWIIFTLISLTLGSFAYWNTRLSVETNASKGKIQFLQARTELLSEFWRRNCQMSKIIEKAMLGNGKFVLKGSEGTRTCGVYLDALVTFEKFTTFLSATPPLDILDGETRTFSNMRYTMLLNQFSRDLSSIEGLTHEEYGMLDDMFREILEPWVALKESLDVIETFQIGYVRSIMKTANYWYFFLAFALALRMVKANAEVKFEKTLKRKACPSNS